MAARNMTFSVSKETNYSWELGGWARECQAKQCRDAERCGWSSGWAVTATQHQTSWYHLSVQWHSLQRQACSKDWAHQPLIFSPKPWKMLQRSAGRVRDLPPTVLIRINVPKQQKINITVGFLRKHDIHAGERGCSFLFREIYGSFIAWKKSPKTRDSYIRYISYIKF